MYTAYNFTGASIQVNGGEWIPIKGDVTASLEYDIPPIDTGWRKMGDRLFHVRDVRFHVPLLRIFTSKPSMARRKIWRYMEHCGL